MADSAHVAPADPGATPALNQAARRRVEGNLREIEVELSLVPALDPEGPFHPDQLEIDPGGPKHLLNRLGQRCPRDARSRIVQSQRELGPVLVEHAVAVGIDPPLSAEESAGSSRVVGWSLGSIAADPTGLSH